MFVVFRQFFAFWLLLAVVGGRPRTDRERVSEQIDEFHRSELRSMGGVPDSQVTEANYVLELMEKEEEYCRNARLVMERAKLEIHHSQEGEQAALHVGWEATRDSWLLDHNLPNGNDLRARVRLSAMQIQRKLGALMPTPRVSKQYEKLQTEEHMLLKLIDCSECFS